MRGLWCTAAALLVLVGCGGSSPGQEGVPGDPNWKQLGAPLQETDGVDAHSASLVLDASGIPTLAFVDNTEGFPSFVSVYRYGGGTWTPLGQPFHHVEPTSRGASKVVLALKPDGNPVVLFDEDDSDPQTGAFGSHPFLSVWDGTQWQEEGPLPIAYGDDLAVGPDGAVYVEFLGSVIRRDPTTGTWSELGDHFVSSAISGVLALDGEGTPYVATDFRPDTGSHSQVVVSRWNGSAWEALGTPIDIDGISTRSPSLKIGSDGQPRVAYADESGTAAEVGVSKWNGTGWEALGAPLSWNHQARLPKLALDGDGTAWVAFEESVGGGWQIFVRRFSGTGWTAVGDAVSTPVGAEFYSTTDLAFAVHGGSPLVAATRVTTPDATDAAQAIYVEQY